MFKVTIIVPIYLSNSTLFSMTKRCFDDLNHKTVSVQKEIIVINDASPKTKLTQLLQSKFFPDFIWLHNTSNLGFAQSINRGIDKATSDYILLLNNDVIIQDSKWLFNMVTNMINNNLDITSPEFGWLDKDWHYIPKAERHKHDESKVFKYPVGWCLLVKREVFEKQKMPECFFKGYFEDVFWWWKIREHFKAGITQVGIKHLEHITFKQAGYNLREEYEKKRKIFLSAMGEKNEY